MHKCAQSAYRSVTVVAGRVAVIADDATVGERKAEMITLIEMQPHGLWQLNLQVINNNT